MTTSDVPGGGPFDAGLLNEELLTKLANDMLRSLGPARAPGSLPGSSPDGGNLPPSTAPATSSTPRGDLSRVESFSDPHRPSAGSVGAPGSAGAPSLDASAIPGANSPLGSVPNLGAPIEHSSSPYYFLDFAKLATGGPSALPQGGPGALSPNGSFQQGLSGHGASLQGLSHESFSPHSLPTPGVPTLQSNSPFGLPSQQTISQQSISAHGRTPQTISEHGATSHGVSPSALAVRSHLAEQPRRSARESSSGISLLENGAGYGRSPATTTSPSIPKSDIGIPELNRGIEPEFARSARPSFDVLKVKRDFPILSERVGENTLVWLDNAATTQKPQSVIDRLAYFYAHENSNIHRAAHELARRATDAYEEAREKVRGFLGARSKDEIIFVRGATEGINLVANAWGKRHLRPGDEIVVSHLEHHANIVPWQLIARETGAKLRVIPVDDDGQIILSEYAKLLGPRTKLVAVTQVSNALGTITPVQEIVAMAKGAGITTLIDGAQSVSHMPVNVASLGADFFIFSGHKVFGPTGIGAVYGRREILEDMNPYQGGGNMIADVTFEKTTFQPAPAFFEAGTGNIADAVGLGAALDYVSEIGMSVIEAYEHELLAYGTNLLKGIPGLRLIGTAAQKASVLSFTLEGFRTDEVGALLNRDGIAVRGGHHCAQPILRRFGLESTVRPSLAFYNDCSDLDRLAASLLKIVDSKKSRSSVPH